MSVQKELTNLGKNLAALEHQIDVLHGIAAAIGETDNYESFELNRLQAENLALKAKIRSLEATMESHNLTGA